MKLAIKKSSRYQFSRQFQRNFPSKLLSSPIKRTFYSFIPLSPHFFKDSSVPLSILRWDEIDDLKLIFLLYIYTLQLHFSIAFRYLHKRGCVSEEGFAIKIGDKISSIFLQSLETIILSNQFLNQIASLCRNIVLKISSSFFSSKRRKERSKNSKVVPNNLSD